MKWSVTTSGATIIELGDYVVKLGEGAVGQRIGAQADWLEEYADRNIMPVTKVNNFCYVMPRCNEWCWPGSNKYDAEQMFEVTASALEAAVWKHSPRFFGVDPQRQFRNKIASLTSAIDGERWDELFSEEREILWSGLPRCLAHGDPTFCNVMQYRGTWVLADPLPSGVLPDLRCVDLGKILQSLMGYEHIRYGWEYVVPPDPMWVRQICADDNEWQATKTMALLHIVRLMPYVGKQYKTDFEEVFDAILRL